MKIHNNYSLKSHNTFRIDIKAKYFAEIETEEDLDTLLQDEKFKNEKILILGDGANILFTKDFEGLVIKVALKGISIVEETDEKVILKVASGENWNDLVWYAVKHNWGGIENMVMIPGTVGAAPVQNIAAYGQNFEDIFMNLEATELETKEKKIFDKSECKFAYRTSRFKGEDRNKYLVTSVTMELTKNPVINTTYFETGKTYAKNISLEEELARIATAPYTLVNVAQAVSNIRKKKLPDPEVLGTAGSFFKNPVVTKKRYEELKQQDFDLQCYPVNKLNYPKLNDPSLSYDDYVKIPAGRLLDNLGWKGKRIGNVGTYKNQALAVVNYGASAKEVLLFTNQMEEDVLKKYNIALEPEVIVI